MVCLISQEKENDIHYIDKFLDLNFPFWDVFPGNELIHLSVSVLKVLGQQNMIGLILFSATTTKKDAESTVILIKFLFSFLLLTHSF